ncbi:MAG: hypothetical protein NC037_01400 [Bacteroides sp.]|nr:hypothetical protein [Bacillota bacterium]MCM1393428.1 hypothetical protein [[Eubacterium] siraeum]MCM1455171.1 hypothetical protein [Bacteroides sp.]
MNFDSNMLNTLIQLLGAQKPRENADSGDDRSYKNASDSQGQSQSVFAMQNGLGKRVNLDGEKKSASANPLSAIFDSMGGKGGNGDMMSNLMPMLLNMMSKPAQVANANKDDNFKQKLKNAVSDADKNNLKGDDDRVDNAADLYDENVKNRQSNYTKSYAPHDKYSPILFAGYTLVCLLNKLYMAKKYELL